MSDVKISIRLRREACYDSVVWYASVLQVIFDDLLNEIERSLFLVFHKYHPSRPSKGPFEIR